MIALLTGLAGPLGRVALGIIATPLGAGLVSGLVAYHAGHWLGGRDAARLTAAQYERRITKAKEEADARVEKALAEAAELPPVPADDAERRRLCDADPTCRGRRKR